MGGEPCAGVDGYGLPLPGWAKCVNFEWPEALRSLDALTMSVWVAPESAGHQEILSAPAAEVRFDGGPFILRWRGGSTTIASELGVPGGRGWTEKPAIM
ncbi:MAG: hypothetical protein PHR35_08950 [Kiritimatiellae bacterium]|nr:hypothetical protein [Kiritimatiellia bacterium]